MFSSICLFAPTIFFFSIINCSLHACFQVHCISLRSVTSIYIESSRCAKLQIGRRLFLVTFSIAYFVFFYLSNSPAKRHTQTQLYSKMLMGASHVSQNNFFFFNIHKTK